jgi:predicted deacylase
MRRRSFILLIILLLFVFSGCRQAVSVKPAAIPTAGTARSGIPDDKKIVKTDAAYSYGQVEKDAKALEKAYPELVKTDSIGRSVEGRELTLLKLGKGKKNVFLCGAHHAREYITSAYLMRMAEEYAYATENGGKFDGQDIAKLLNDFTLYIVPMVNPDGVNLVQNGVEAVKNPEEVKKMRMMQEGYGTWKANIRGVDLNRQYPACWDVKASNTDVPSSEMYKGPSPASEPEVQAVMKLCGDVRFELAVSFHSKGEVIYWADFGTADAIPAADGLAQTLAQATGYKIMPVSGDPAVYGAGFENWFRLAFSRPGFCIELAPGTENSLPSDDASFETLVWDKAKDLIIRLLQKA